MSDEPLSTDTLPVQSEPAVPKTSAEKAKRKRAPRKKKVVEAPAETDSATAESSSSSEPPAIAPAITKVLERLQKQAARDEEAGKPPLPPVELASVKYADANPDNARQQAEQPTSAVEASEINGEPVARHGVALRRKNWRGWRTDE